MSTKALCAIEFRTPEALRQFLRINPGHRKTTCLTSGQYRLLVFPCADYPTREAKEIFDKAGRHVATFIGPDALEHTYQIKLGEPGESGGYHPEAFQ